MNQFFQTLQQAREAKGITLAQISDLTRIGEHYLEAIEQGNTSILPQAYVRAFLREYAGVVGLDPDEVMKKYDELQGAKAPQSPPQAAVPSSPLQAEPRPDSIERTVLHPAAAKFALITAALLVVAIVLWNMLGRETPPITEEIPFQSVVKEQEQRLAPGPAAAAPGILFPRAPADSLTLRCVTTDSVWVLVVIDQQEPREYLFPPNKKAIWRALDRFAVTLGNAGAVEFTLNQQSLGTLGKRGSVVRSVELNRQTLSSHQPRP